MYFIYYFTQKHFPPICTAENALSDRRGEAGKGGRWAKGAINDILIVTCCMKFNDVIVMNYEHMYKKT